MPCWKTKGLQTSVWLFRKHANVSASLLRVPKYDNHTFHAQPPTHMLEKGTESGAPSPIHAGKQRAWSDTCEGSELGS